MVNIICHRNAFLGHITRVHEDMPDLKVLYCHINLALGQPPILSGNIVLIGPAVAGLIRSGRLKMTSHQ